MFEEDKDQEKLDRQERIKNRKIDVEKATVDKFDRRRRKSNSGLEPYKRKNPRLEDLLEEDWYE